MAVITPKSGIVFITRSHILSEIHLKFFMEFLVLIFLIGRWSVNWWLVHLVGGCLVGWKVVGGRLVGGFKFFLYHIYYIFNVVMSVLLRISISISIFLKEVIFYMKLHVINTLNIQGVFFFEI